MEEFNFETIIALLIIVFFIFLFLYWRFGKETVWKKSYWVRKSIFTPTEYKFYNSLNAYLGKNWLHSEYSVFTKIRMIDIFYPDKTWNGKENKKYVYKILSKHIDFIITDKKWAPKLLIELDDKYHNGRDYYRSDELKNDISKYTWLPLVRFTASNYYNFTKIENYL